MGMHVYKGHVRPDRPSVVQTLLPSIFSDGGCGYLGQLCYRRRIENNAVHEVLDAGSPLVVLMSHNPQCVASNSFLSSLFAEGANMNLNGERGGSGAIG